MSTGTAAGGRVTVVVSDSLDEGVALLSDLPSPGGQAYQLWLVKGAVPVSVGLLAPGATGTVHTFTAVHGAGAFGVSREPSTGSRTPTQPLVTSFALT